jgi:hypothetical protein
LNNNQAINYVKEVSNLCQISSNSISFEEQKSCEPIKEYVVHIKGAIRDQYKVLIIYHALKHSLTVRDENNELTIYGKNSL